MVFQVILAAVAGLAVEHLSGSAALAVTLGAGMVLLHLVQRARAMWRDAHDW
jgi:hypothetical protein